MGHIKEPKGMDFIIQSKPLTDDNRAAIIEYIRNYKSEKIVTPRPRRKTGKKVSAY